MAGIHVDSSGSFAKPRSQSPKVINAWAQARDSFAKTLIGGIILGILTIAYIVALFKEIAAANNILVMISSGLGFLLGGRDKNPPSNP